MCLFRKRAFDVTFQKRNPGQKPENCADDGRVLYDALDTIAVDLYWGFIVPIRSLSLLWPLYLANAPNRDTQAIHAKLDELLRAVGKAESDLAMLDQRSRKKLRHIAIMR